MANQAGAFYLWEDGASAEAVHYEACRQSVREKFGSEPSIRYFDTPLVVDNALGQTIEQDGINPSSNKLVVLCSLRLKGEMVFQG